MLATLTVSVADDGAISTNDGNLTLREAIFYVKGTQPQANDLKHIDLTEPFGSNDIILFSTVDGVNGQGGVTSNLDGETITLTQGQLPIIRDSVTIDASMLMSGLTIDAQQDSKVFDINLSATGTDQEIVILQSLTITGFYAIAA